MKILEYSLSSLLLMVTRSQCIKIPLQSCCDMNVCYVTSIIIESAVNWLTGIQHRIMFPIPFSKHGGIRPVLVDQIKVHCLSLIRNGLISNCLNGVLIVHDDVIKLTHFPLYCPLVLIIHRWPPVTGEFLARPVTVSFDIFYDLHLIKWLSKQSWG